MRRLDTSPIRRLLPVLFAVLAIAGCGRHYLNQYDFTDKTLALVYVDPPAPSLLHGWYNLDVGDSPLQTVVRAGANVAKEVEVRRASARLDTASLGVDVPARLAERTLERASRYLGTNVVAAGERADYVLEIHMRSFGIDARSNRATYLFTRAEAVLLDARTGREIWNEDVRGSRRMTPYVIGTGHIPSAIITAGALHTVTVADFEAALEQLVTFTSSLITDDLRSRLRDVRHR